MNRRIFFIAILLSKIGDGPAAPVFEPPEDTVADDKRLIIGYLSPCDDIVSRHLVPDNRLLSSELGDQCKEDYVKEVLAAIDYVGTCHPGVKRHKRGIQWVDVVNTAVDIYQGVTNFISCKSDVSVVDQIDKLKRELQNDFNVTREMNRDIEQKIKNITYEIKSVNEYISSVPSALWEVSKARSKIALGGERLRAIGRLCKRGRLATLEASELIDKPELAEIEPESTRITQIKIFKNSETINIDFKQLKPSQLKEIYNFVTKYSRSLIIEVLNFILVLFVCIKVLLKYGAPRIPFEVKFKSESQTHTVTHQDETDIIIKHFQQDQVDDRRVIESITNQGDAPVANCICSSNKDRTAQGAAKPQ